MSVDPANARELVNISEEVGAVVIDGALRYPSETGGWQVGGVDLSEFLAQYRDQQVVLILAPIGAADPDVIQCGICGFPMNDAGRCPRCALVMRDQAAAIQREIEAERLLDDIERFLTGLDDGVSPNTTGCAVSYSWTVLETCREVVSDYQGGRSCIRSVP